MSNLKWLIVYALVGYTAVLALLRDGLTRLLQDSGMEVVAAVADGGRFVSAAFGHKPLS